MSKLTFSKFHEMLRRSLTVFLFYIALYPCFAQQLPVDWVRRFQAQGKASDRIARIITDAAGDIYVAGYAGNHHGSPDAFVMKRNLQGDTLWSYYYDSGIHEEDFATALFVDTAGNCYITGNSVAPVTFFRECFTAKILANGQEAWTKRYSPGTSQQSYGNAITADQNGNVYVAGYTDPSSASTDWLVIKYNSSGNEEWVDVFNGPDNGGDEATDIVIAPNGNPTVCGYIYSLNVTGGINAYIKQYTTSGGTVWSDSWTNPGYTGTDKAYGLGYSASGDLLVGGETYNSNLNYDAFALRYDANGIRQWESIFPDPAGTMDEYLREVIINDSGDVYFTGTNYQDAYVTKINSNGSTGWRKLWSGDLSNGHEVFHGISVDKSGNVYATGRGVYPGEDYYGNGGKTNMVIVKYNSNGDSLWTYRCMDTLNSSMGFSVTTRDGKVYAGGFTTDTAYVNENLYTLVIDTSGNSVVEWIYNGIGDAITKGQFVQCDANNNVYCAATIDRLYNNGTDIALIKYDQAGNLLWEKYYSSYGWNNDTLTGLQLDPGGNIILSLSTDSALMKNNYKLFLLKADANGNFIDTTSYGNQISGSLLAASMDIRNDGSIALAVNSNTNGGLVVYFDSTFNYSWSAKIDTTQFAISKANCVAFLPGSDFIVGGKSQTGSYNPGLINRYDHNGNLIWSARIDSAGVSDEIRGVAVNTTGEIAYTGLSGTNNAYACILGKIAGNNGNILWQQLYNPGTSRENGVKCAFTSTGNVAFICRGWTGSVARYYTGQYNNAGIFQWSIIYSFTASDREPIDLVVDATDRIVTAGWAINGFSTNYDYVLAGYDNSGAIEFINTYTDTVLVSSSWDQLNDLTMDARGNFIVTGQSSQEFYNDYLFKMLTIKYGGTIAGIGENEFYKQSSTLVYPNPSANGVFNLLDASPLKLKSIKVFDLQGRLICNPGHSSSQINMKTFPAGIYILSLEREDSSAEHIRLIKN